MDLKITVLLAGACLALAVFAGWRGARPPDPMRGPRLAPWRMIMMFAVCGLLVLATHLVNLLGVKTGR